MKKYKQEFSDALKIKNTLSFGIKEPESRIQKVKVEGFVSRG